MTKFDEENSAPEQIVTIEDVIDVLKGRATDTQRRRVAKSLDDPDSQPSAWVASLAKWARESLPHTAHSRPDARMAQMSGGLRQLELLHDFLKAKRASGTITDEEFTQLNAVAEIDVVGVPPTATEVQLVIKQTINAIVGAHPELDLEVRDLLSARHR